MEFFGIIFYIIIIVIFISAKKAAQSGNAHGRSHNRSNLPGNYSGQKAYTHPKSMTQKDNVSNRETKTLPNVSKSGKTVIPNVSKNGKTVIPNVPMKKRVERTFMEPHKEEAFQPRIRTNNLWGEDEHAKQRIVALRLMEGDPVPEGYVKIKCPYCAADNIVTKNCKQYHSCYFCRVPID